MSLKRFDPITVVLIAALLLLCIGAGSFVYVSLRMDAAFTRMCNAKGGTSIIIKGARLCLRSQSVIEVVQ